LGEGKRYGLLGWGKKKKKKSGAESGSKKGDSFEKKKLKHPEASVHLWSRSKTRPRHLKEERGQKIDLIGDQAQRLKGLRRVWRLKVGEETYG